MFNLFSRFSFSSYRTFQTLNFASSTQQFSAISNSLIMADQKDGKGETLGSGNNGAVGKSHSPVADKKGEAGKGGNQFSTQRVTRQEALELEKKRYLSMPLGEKRKLYQCKDKYSVLDDVPKWNEYFKENQARLLNKWKGKKFRTTYTTNQEINQKVAIWRGDITCIEIDAIVNAANNSLLGGGGVDGAIHRAAGKMLVGECKGLNGCESGDAKITGGYKLPAKYVIHTVGPIGEKPWLLQSAYNKCLDLVKQEQLTSVAFPCISTGIYGYPNLKAAQLAMEHVRQFLEDEEVAKTIDCIVFCLFLPTDVDIYETLMQVYFPVDGDDTSTQPTTGENDKKETENQASGDEKAGEEVNGDAAATKVVENDPDTKENGEKAETQRSCLDFEKEGSGKSDEKLEDKLDQDTGSSTVEETVTDAGETKKAETDSEVTCKDGEGKTSKETLGQGVVKEETDDLKDIFMESAAAAKVEEVKVGSEDAIKDIKADCLRDQEEVGKRTVVKVEGGQGKGECEFDNSRGEDDSPQSKKKALVQDTKL